MKIIFIVPANYIRRNPIYRFFSSFYGHKNSITGPLILGHILKDAGHEVEVYEELNAKVDLRKIKDKDIVCLSAMTANVLRAYEIADLAHKLGKKVIIGGIHASSMPEEAAQHADCVVVGEGEAVITDIVEGRLTDKIVFAPCVKDLDSVPFPDYSLLKTPCEAANILTTRGCTHKCSFCTTSRMFAPYRERSVKSVIEELRYYKKLGFQYMNFEDDNFTANKERTKEILRQMIANDLIFKETFFFGRTDMYEDEEMLTLLKQAHLNRVLVGIESLNQNSLNYINKGQKISDIIKCAESLTKHKIKLIASIVLGLEYDDIADIRKAVNFCKRVGAYQLQPAVLTPFPKTPVYEQLIKEGRILDASWDCYDMMNVTFRPQKMSAWELQKEFFRATRKFYNLASVIPMMFRFGIDAGFRRLGLWVSAVGGIIFFRIMAKANKNSLYYQLRKMHLNSRPSKIHTRFSHR